MPAIDLSILNQRQTPAFYADVFANRPAAGFVGRIFVSTNTFAFYRDNGTGWDLIGGPGTGTVTGSGAAGQVAFWSGSSLISGENNLWWDSTNNHFGINTNTPGTAADIHHDQSTILQLNQTTATKDTRIAFQNGGSSKWRVGNFYNLGSNDYAVNDATLNINRFTVKSSSGQTFVGDETTSSGLFVVNNSSGDAHIVALGATAPSIRVRNAGVGASLQFGLGLATTTNNFIQGATGGEFCIFNDSLTAQPILFGIKDAGLGNTQEAARISAARNFLIGTTTDAGQKLQVSGTALITGAATFNSTITTNANEGLVIAPSSGASYQNFKIGATSYSLIGIAGASNDIITGSAAGDLNIRATNSQKILFSTNNGASASLTIASTGAATFRTPSSGSGVIIRHLDGTNNPGLFIETNESTKYVTLTASGSSPAGQLLQLGAVGNAGTLNISASNVLIGTTTDNGNKLQVNGNANFQNPNSNSGNGGFTFFTLRIQAGITTNFYQVPSANWGGITEITWVSSADSNRSGAALLRWAYDIPSATTGVVFTAYSNNQNAVPTFTFGGGYLRIDIAGGSADYYVQFRIQGSQAV